MTGWVELHVQALLCGSHASACRDFAMALYPLNSCHFFLTIIPFLLLRLFVASFRIIIAITITCSGNFTLPPPSPFATLMPLRHGFMPALIMSMRGTAAKSGEVVCLADQMTTSPLPIVSYEFLDMRLPIATVLRTVRANERSLPPPRPLPAELCSC